jgi:hypothetical protein
MTPASPIHALIQGELARLIGSHLIASGRPCSVAVTPGIIPRVQSDINTRIPDLAVTCSPALPDDNALRDPILLIEILLPSNRVKTWTNPWELHDHSGFAGNPRRAVHPCRRRPVAPRCGRDLARTTAGNLRP